MSRASAATPPRALSGLHLLLTYECNFECDHCFVWGGPDQNGTMSFATVEHILRHANDIPTRDGPHGVFDGDSKVIFPLIDEAWKRAKS